MRLITIGLSEKPDKRFVAHFQDANGVMRRVHFGYKNPDKPSLTWIDGASERVRDNYISRHSAREWRLWQSDFMAPATLSRYIIWGRYRDVKSNLSEYKIRFGI